MSYDLLEKVRITAFHFMQQEKYDVAPRALRAE
jgi:hypothetical protein